MSSPGLFEPTSFKRLARASLDVVSSLELDPDHIERFLGPVEDIVAAVRKGPAHAMFAIGAGDHVVGFYVLHPDRRDAACWWLGWIALDRRQQGRGYGRAAVAHIMSSVRRIAGCRRVRLLVAADNAAALRLYTQAAFRPAGVSDSGELILEAKLADLSSAGILLSDMIRVVVRPGHASRQGRLRLSAGPYAARMIGVERGPPARTRRTRPACQLRSNVA